MKNLPSYKTLTTYTGETRVFTLGNECLVSVLRSNGWGGRDRMLVAVTKDGYRTDYPIAYDSGSIGWDTPEYFTKRFRERAARHIRAFGK